MIKYPSQLPLPLLDGRSSQRVETVLRTQMQSGRTRSRLMFEKTPTGQGCRFLFTQAQAYFFELWFNEKLKSGVLEFEINLRMTDGLRPRVVKFMSMYKGPVMTGPNQWTVSANIEIRDRITTGDNPDWVEFPEFYFNADIIDLAVNREWPEA